MIINVLIPAHQYDPLMHYTDPVYRPLYEAGSLLIEAMIGSSQNANRSALCTGDSLFPPSLWTRSRKIF